jgi:hypothetical protein
MAGSFSLPVGGYTLTPSSTKAALPTNYLASNQFDFLNQYLPDTVKDDFEVYGNRSISSFLRLVGAEEPSASDLIKWSEQGRLHTKYDNVTAVGASGGDDTVTFDVGTSNHVFRAGQVVFLSNNGGSSSYKAIIIDAAPSGDATRFEVAFYNATGIATADTGATFSAFVYGSEFKKGDTGMEGSLEAESEIREVKPVIIKDRYAVSGSDMAQIGWIEVEGSAGTGYLWYLRSEHETRMRFDDYLEMMMVEHVPTETGSGAAATAVLGATSGTQGFFDAVEDGGNVWSGGNPSTIADFDAILKRLDKNAAIQQNVLFVERDFAIDIDDMLAAQNSYGVGGTSYGMFDNDEDMAINLGFDGFRRGSYDFYKTDWKYLNDASTRGGIVGGKVNGVLVPAGEMSVYDQVLGSKMKRPFLHVRYRVAPNGAEDRRYKTWITGGAGGAMTSDLDAMEVNFLSERALCTVGRNNFVLFKD